MTAPEAPEVLDALEPAPSTGRVAPRAEQTSDGVLDPSWWAGLDAQSQGDVAESLPQPPENEATYEYGMSTQGNPEGPTISNLTVINITATGATVTWDTSEAASSRVVYGTAPNEFGDGTDWLEDDSTSHSVDLSGLTTATIYYVEARARDADGNLNGAQTQFTTA
jgi:hypothetical protein